MLNEGLKNNHEYLNSYLNLIHRDELVSILKFVAKKESLYNNIILATDSTPSQRSEIRKFILGEKVSISAIQSPLKKISFALKANKRCSNKKLLQLGYQFKYPSYREGIKSL